MIVGRKESSTPRFRFLVEDEKGRGVSVDWLLMPLGWLKMVSREQDAYNPRDIDSLRCSNGRSSSDPAGTCASTVLVLVFEACTIPLTAKSKPYVKSTLFVVLIHP